VRIERVDATAFGAIKDQTLEPAPGMTVVYGRNEAGKSTWHAAIYAAICGFRRGRGARKEDKEFRLRHRPWNGDGWAVSCRLKLSDGRRIEINRDLEGKVDDEAIDTDVGQDVSTEIINDGAPDASIWLGLDRRSFLNTACVQQGDVLAVTENADQLQEQLERAAATAGTDATAAKALEMIDVFFAAQVGRDRSNSRRPLRSAITGVENAERLLATANNAHAEFLELDREARELEHLAQAAEENLARARAIQQAEDLAELESKVERAQELTGLFPDGPPPSAVDQDDLANRVTRAITQWTGLPVPPDLSGDSSNDLEEQLTTIPEAPEGDTVVAPEVREARDSYLRALNQVEAHGDLATTTEASVQTDLSASEIRDLARALATQPPDSDGQETDQQTKASSAPVSAMGVAAALLGGGIVLSIAGQLTIGIIAAIAGLAVAGGVVLSTRNRAHKPSVEDVAREMRAQEAHARFAAAEKITRESSLPAEPSKLYGIADQVDRAGRAGASRSDWLTQRDLLQAALESERSALIAALTVRGVEAADEPLEAFAAYEAACEIRSGEAIASARRTDLEVRLEERIALESRASHIREQMATAEADLDSVAAECGIDTAQPETIIASLEVWLLDRQNQIQEQDDRIREWAELNALLRDQTLAQLESQLSTQKAALAPSGYAIDEQSAEGQETLDSDIDELQEIAKGSRSNADAAMGMVRERATQIASVADAEERLDGARDELDRVRKLASLLTITKTFLEEAENKAHRSMAPKLKRDLERWLPMITEGNHSEVAVDVETLEILVREPDGWQPATLLSHGTTEQLYLLLRIAMVDHLSGGNGPCPLLIDDVTVQSDSGRTVSILQMLREMSEERQIILFSQEEEVLRWAEQQLSGANDRLILLDNEGMPTIA